MRARAAPGTLARLLGRLERWAYARSCMDNWAPDAAGSPTGRHCIGKNQIRRDESCHVRQRHWCTCFRSHTCIVFKSVAMVNATMAPFAF